MKAKSDRGTLDIRKARRQGYRGWNGCISTFRTNPKNNDKSLKLELELR